MTPQELADFREEAQQQEEYNSVSREETFELPYGFVLDGVFYDMEDDDEDEEE